MRKQTPLETSYQNDNYFICQRCLSRSKAAKQINLTGQEIHMPLSKLPLYLYPADENEKPVLIGHVIKCINCNEDNFFMWRKEVPQKYNSQKIREAFITANEHKYTRALTEVEIFFPTAFQLSKKDVDFSTYSQRYHKTMKEYNDMMKRKTV